MLLGRFKKVLLLFKIICVFKNELLILFNFMLKMLFFKFFLVILFSLVELLVVLF